MGAVSFGLFGRYQADAYLVRLVELYAVETADEAPAVYFESETACRTCTRFVCVCEED